MKSTRFIMLVWSIVALFATTATAQTTETSTAHIKSMLAEQMVLVKGDTFMMGQLFFELSENPSEQSVESLLAPRTDELPAHYVTLSNFYIGRYEVTQELYNAVMGKDKNPSSVKGDNLPVDNLSWEEAQDFIARLNTLTGENYRLPTEAEWEYAARGGKESMGRLFSGGENPLKYAWFAENTQGAPQPVGQKRANELDLYDMSGNVAEWVFDWYGGYRNVSQANPKGPSAGEHHILRGGSYADSAVQCRVSFRSHLPNEGVKGCGLRLAKGLSLDNLPWSDDTQSN